MRICNVNCAENGKKCFNRMVLTACGWLAKESKEPNLMIHSLYVPSLRSWSGRIPAGLAWRRPPLFLQWPALSIGLSPNSSRRCGGSLRSPPSCGCRCSSGWWLAERRWAGHCAGSASCEPRRSAPGRTRCRRAEGGNRPDSERREVKLKLRRQWSPLQEVPCVCEFTPQEPAGGGVWSETANQATACVLSVDHGGSIAAVISRPPLHLARSRHQTSGTPPTHSPAIRRAKSHSFLLVGENAFFRWPCITCISRKSSVLERSWKFSIMNRSALWRRAAEP